MSYQNYPKVDDTTNSTSFQQTPKNNGSKNLIIGLLGAALLGSFGYIYYTSEKAKDSLAIKDTIINTESTEKDALQKELNEAAAKYDELQNLDTKKDSSLTAKDKDIAAQRAKIQIGRASCRERVLMPV